jgi:hypothetical protein
VGFFFPHPMELLLLFSTLCHQLSTPLPPPTDSQSATASRCCNTRHCMPSLSPLPPPSIHFRYDSAGPLRRCSPGLQRKNRKYGSNTLIDHPIAKQLETCKSVNSTAAQTLSSFLAAPAPGLHRIGHQVNPRRRQPIRRKHFLPSSMCLHNSFNIPVQTFSS